MQLSDSQLAQFLEEGFLILPKFADKLMCDTINDLAKVHLHYQIPPIETELEYSLKSKEERKSISDAHSQEHEERVYIRRLRQVYSRDIVFKQWMENEKIRPILKQVLGEKVAISIAHHNSIMTKMPHTSTQTSWHQDFRYWHFDTDNLVSIWLALDNENAENGVLEFIPKSHNMLFTENQFDEKEYFSETLEENKSIIKTKVSHNLQKGDVVLFHCKLLHRANKNASSKAKISFVYTVKGVSNHAISGTRSDSFPDVILK